MKHRLSLELHYAKRYGVSSHLEHTGSEETPEFAVNRLHGWVSFICSVEGTARQRLYQQWLRVQGQVRGEPPGDEYYEDPPES